MNKARNPVLIAMALALAASACQAGLPFARQVAPVSSPVSPAPAQVQTGAGKPAVVPAATITATRQVLTPTPSVTMTAFPSITPLPPPSATPTETPFGFVPTGTPTEFLTPADNAPDPVEGATDDWGSQTRCTLISKTPEDWMIVAPGGVYRASWKLFNSGVRTWQANEMLLVYIEGARLFPPDSKNIQLNKDVKVGSTITPAFSFVAPKTAGHYRSVWGLRMNKDHHVFCTFTIKVTVQ